MLVGSLLRASRVAVAALAIGAVAAQAAAAATVTFDKPCYLAAQPGLEKGQIVSFSGTGFTPNAPVSGTLDGTPIGSGSASPSGTITGSVNAPATHPERFTGLPSTGNPRTQKVRFYVYGFDAFQAALGAKTHQNVYLHIVDPRQRVRANKKLGRTKGSCGTLRSARQRIMAFEPIPGSWRYVFDLEKTYRQKPRTARAVVRYVITRRA